MAYSGTVTTNGANLMIRKGASVSTPFIGRIPNGTKITITEVVDKPGGWKWGKVTYKGVTGWVCIKEPGVGTWVKIQTQNPPKPSPPPPPPTPPKKDGPNVDAIANAMVSGNKNQSINVDTPDPIKGSAVQYGSERLPASGISDADDVLKNEVTGDYISAPGINDVNASQFIQNSAGFPKALGMKDGLYRYNYYMDYSSMDDDFETIARNNNRGFKTRRESYISHVKNYNRFKIANPENVLSKSFAHVFFIRPDLNILVNAGSGNFELSNTVKNDPSFYYALQHSPEILTELIHNNGDGHDFLFTLSNAVGSFEVSDEYIKTEAYGESYTGFKIPIGKHNFESQAAGTFNITYTDDRDLHIYHIHKIWTEYISSVYRGEIKSKDQYIQKKILDYATAVYYILTAEDGETILFWTKYYGVFPTNTPASATSWTKGNLLRTPDFTITYNYAFKEDFNPLSLVELNMHSQKSGVYKYVKTYEKKLLSTGQTMVGAPFIETLGGSLDLPYTMKLRFRRGR